MGEGNYHCNCPFHTEILRQSTAQTVGFPPGWLACFSAHLALSKHSVFCPVEVAFATAGTNSCALGVGCAHVWS